MKRIECDFCRDVMFDPFEWHWEIKKKCFRTGDKKTMHICARCGQALLDVVSEKRRTYDSVPTCGEEE